MKKTIFKFVIRKIVFSVIISFFFSTSACEDKIDLCLSKPKEVSTEFLLDKSIANLRYLLQSNTVVKNKENIENLLIKSLEPFVSGVNLGDVYQKITTSPVFQEVMLNSKQKLTKAEIGTEKDLLLVTLRKNNVPKENIEVTQNLRLALFDVRDRLSKKYKGEKNVDMEVALADMKSEMRKESEQVIENSALKAEEKENLRLVVNLTLELVDLKLRPNPAARAEFKVCDDPNNALNCAQEIASELLIGGFGAAGAALTIAAAIGITIAAPVIIVIGFIGAVLCWVFC